MEWDLHSWLKARVMFWLNPATQGKLNHAWLLEMARIACIWYITVLLAAVFGIALLLVERFAFRLPIQAMWHRDYTATVTRFLFQPVLELELQLLKGWSVIKSMWHWSVTKQFKVNVLEASRARQDSRKPKARVNSRTGLSPVHYLPVTRTVTALVVAVIYKPTHCAQSPQREFETTNYWSMSLWTYRMTR